MLLFTVHLLPGASEPVEGQVDHDLKDLDLLRVETSTETIQLKIDRFQTGYWLGGNMWIGSISAAADAAAGTYDLRVFAVNKPPDAPVAAFRAHVYPDYPSLRKSFLSVIRRTFDIPPGTVALACLPVLGVVLGMIYLLGRRVERLLALEGRAEVFMVKEAPGGLEVYFGLGKSHGVQPGRIVQLRTEQDQLICEAVVQQVDENNAMALADLKGIAPRRVKPSLLLELYRASRKKISYRELGRRMDFMESDALDCSYMGYAIKNRN